MDTPWYAQQIELLHDVRKSAKRLRYAVKAVREATDLDLGAEAAEDTFGYGILYAAESAVQAAALEVAAQRVKELR